MQRTGAHEVLAVAYSPATGAVAVTGWPPRWTRKTRPAFARACAVAAIPMDVPLVACRSAVRADGSMVRQKKWSGLALSSFIIAMVAFVVQFVAAVGVSTGVKATDSLMVCTGLSIFAMMGANLVGGILGLIALTQPIRNKWMAAIGLAVNMLEILGMIGLMVVGSQSP